jgi:hypothetical protein
MPPVDPLHRLLMGGGGYGRECPISPISKNIAKKLIILLNYTDKTCMPYTICYTSDMETATNNNARNTEMKTSTWVIVQTFDCTEPVAMHGGSTEREAMKLMETFKAGWGEWEWDHCTECVVKELATAILRPINN